MEMEEESAGAVGFFFALLGRKHLEAPQPGLCRDGGCGTITISPWCGIPLRPNIRWRCRELLKAGYGFLSLKIHKCYVWAIVYIPEK
jgi:hypothetical protein